MSEVPSQVDLDLVTSEIQKYPNSTITGAVLGTLIRKAAPELDIRKAVNLPSGTGALSRFIEQFLTHALRKLGRTASDASGGGDILYEIVSPTATSRSTDDYWNTFVRPSESRILVLKKTTDGYHLHVRNMQNELNPEDEEVIARITSEEFISISNEFIDQLASSESGRPLAEKLQQAESYASFVELLKEAGHSYFAEWSEHRRNCLRSLFVARLDSLGLSPHDRRQLLSSLDQSQEEARQEIRQKSRMSASVGHANIARRNPPIASPEHFAREAFKAVIDRMSLAEIRAIPVTFGHVLDVFLSLQRQK